MVKCHVAEEEEERGDFSDAATDPSTAQPLTQTQP